MIVALGKKPEDEYHTNLHLLGGDIKGDTALLFTSQSLKQLRAYLAEQADELPTELIAVWKKDGSYKKFKKSSDADAPMED